MTKITFHFTEVAWTGDEADLAVANEAYVR